MIRFESLTKRYGKREVLSRLSLVLRAGRVTGILGPNACGKTTLIKTLLGLAIPQSGSILADGATILGDWHFREKTGYMPQNPDYPANLTITELLKMVEELRVLEAPRKQELIAYFGLSSMLTQPFGQLSGGSRQKVAATLALMFDAPLIILDEPTAGLDPVSAVRFKELLVREAQAGKTIALISHILPEVEQLAQDVLFLAEGQVVFTGSLEELRERTGEPRLERAITHLLEVRSP